MNKIPYTLITGAVLSLGLILGSLPGVSSASDVYGLFIALQLV